jgi:DNA invertase Pin-like site-specific DNA recombinase
LPRIVGYARVSTHRQEEEGLSLEAQQRRLTEAGATELLVDVMSGAKDHRPQFRELLQLVLQRQVDGVIVTKLDRLTRSITARAEIYEAFTQPGAPPLRALDDGIDLSTASGRQMFDLLGALATGERERIRERILDGLEARRALGLYVGATPWGLRLTRTGCGVEIDPALQPQVEAVLQIMREERTVTNAAKRIATELGLVKSRSVWRTWLNSPHLSGSLPQGCKDRGVARRQYASITPGAFSSYLTPVEQQGLLAKFTNPKRGPRQHAPEHPTRGRVFCGCCGKPMQRRLDDKKQPRWLTCSNIHCDVGRRSISMPEATDVLLRAAFYFGRADLEARVLRQQQQQAQRERPVSPREAELEATICALQALDPTIVGVALETAQKELASIRHSHDTATAVATVDSARVLRLLEWLAAADLEQQDSQRLTDLVQLLRVSLTTKQHPTRTFGGKPVVVLDRAFLRRGTELEQSIAVEELPPFGTEGGAFSFAELAVALRSSSRPWPTKPWPPSPGGKALNRYPLQVGLEPSAPSRGWLATLAEEQLKETSWATR